MPASPQQQEFARKNHPRTIDPRDAQWTKSTPRFTFPSREDAAERRRKALEWSTTPLAPRWEGSPDDGPLMGRVKGGYNFLANEFTSPLDLGIDAGIIAAGPIGLLGKGISAISKMGKVKKAALGTAAGAGLTGLGVAAASDINRSLNDPSLNTAQSTELGLQGGSMALLPLLGAGWGAKKVAKKVAKDVLPKVSKKAAARQASKGPEMPKDPTDPAARQEFYEKAPPLGPKPDRQAAIQDAGDAVYRARAERNGTSPEIEKLSDAIEAAPVVHPERSLMDHAKMIGQYSILAAERMRRLPRDVRNFWFRGPGEMSETGRVLNIQKGYTEYVSDNFWAGAAALARRPRGNAGWWTDKVNAALERTGYQQVVLGRRHEKELNHEISNLVGGMKEMAGDIVLSSIRTDLEGMGLGGQELMQAITRYSNTLGIQGGKYITITQHIMKDMSQDELSHFVNAVTGAKAPNMPGLAPEGAKKVQNAVDFWNEEVNTKLVNWGNENGVSLSFEEAYDVAPDAITDGEFMNWLDVQFREVVEDGAATASKLLPKDRIRLAQGLDVKVDGVSYNGNNLRNKFKADIRDRRGIHATKAGLTQRIYGAVKNVAVEQGFRDPDSLVEEIPQGLTPRQTFTDRQIQNIRDTFGKDAATKADMYMTRILNEDILPIQTAADIFTSKGKQASVNAVLWNYPLVALPQGAFSAALNTTDRAIQHATKLLTQSDARQQFQELSQELGADQLTQSFLYDANLLTGTGARRFDQFTAFERNSRAYATMNGMDAVYRMEMRLRKNPEDMRAREFFKTGLGLPEAKGDSMLDDMIWRSADMDAPGLDGFLTDDEFMRANHHFLRMTSGNADPVNMPYQASEFKYKLLYFWRKMILVNLESARYVTRTDPKALPKLMLEYATLLEIGDTASDTITSSAGELGEMFLGVENRGPIDTLGGRVDEWQNDLIGTAVERFTTGKIFGSSPQFFSDLYQGRPNNADLLMLLAPTIKNVVSETIRLNPVEASAELVSGVKGPLAGNVIRTAAEALEGDEEPEQERRRLTRTPFQRDFEESANPSLSPWR